MKTLNFEDLIHFRKKAQADLNVRELSYDAVSEKACGLAVGTEHIQLLCCGGTGCKASNSAKIVDNLKAAIEANGIANKVEVIVTGCFGFCEKGPIVKVIPDNTFYTQVKPEDAEEIVKEHVIGGHRVERLLYVDPKTSEHVSDSKHMDFYRKQKRVALRNCGFINPENIAEYIARDGYMALSNALQNQT
ncbi:MAG: NAD(P)H-dependent oxidoreductase subunit E, partial [Muribaculaceae bacterium]|nr:NAD(P)H-dependent oxidoreductase subunit E [Muribaculaceae bacterium]